MKPNIKLKIAMFLIVIQLAFLCVSGETIRINYYAPADDELINSTTTNESVNITLPGTLLNLELENLDSSFKVFIESLNVSDYNQINLSARDINPSSLPSTLSNGDYIIIDAYAFKIKTDLNKTYKIMLNKSGTTKPFIVKTPFNFTTNETNTASADYSFVTYYDDDYAWINISSFSGFILTEDHCNNNIQDYDETGKDCGGSCAACPGPSRPGRAGGGAAGGGAGAVSGTYITGPAEITKISHVFSIVNSSLPLILPIDNPNIPLTNIYIAVYRPALLVEINIQAMERKPSIVPDAPGIVYSYFDISAINLENSNIYSGRFEFKVSQDWVEQKNVDKDSITLYRYEGSWEKLPTVYKKASGGYYYYETSVGKLSVYAISGAGITPEVEIPVVEKPEVVPEKEKPEEIAPEEPEEKISPLLPFILVGIIMVLMLVAVIEVYRHKHEALRLKQREELSLRPESPEEEAKEIETTIKYAGPVVEEAKEFLSKPEVKKVMGITGNRIDALRKYVDYAISRGYAKEEISEVLLKKGWTKEIVEEVLKNK